MIVTSRFTTQFVSLSLQIRRVGFDHEEDSPGVGDRARHRQHREPAPLRRHAVAVARWRFFCRQGLGQAGGRRGGDVQLSEGHVKNGTGINLIL